MATRGWTNDGPVSPYGGLGVHPTGGYDGPETFHSGPKTVAKMGQPLPIVYGTAPVNGSLLYAWRDPTTARDNDPIYKPSAVSGTGYLQSNGQTSTALIGICQASELWEHTVTRIKPEGTRWLDADEFYFLIARSEGGLTSSIEWVTTPSATAWTGATSHGAEAIAYTGIIQMRAAYLTLRDGKIPGFKFEVRGRCAGADGKAHPADVAIDLLTATDIRAPRLLASQVVTDVGLDGSAASSWRTYCTARGFRVSRAITDPTDIIGLIDELCGATNSTVIRTGGKLKFVPLEDAAVGGNGASYVPPSTVVDIDEDEILFDSGDDPIAVKTIPSDDVRNAYPLVILDEEAGWAEATYRHVEQSHAAKYGLRLAPDVRNDWITNRRHAVLISSMLAARSIGVRSKFEFTVGPRWACLEPEDRVAISDGKIVSSKRVRITAIEDQSDGSRKVFADEWRTGTARIVDLTPQSHDGYDTNPTVPQDPATNPSDWDADPGDADAPVVATLPYLFAQRGSTLVLATSGGDTWGGCEVWAGFGSDPLEYRGSTGSVKHGVLGASLAAGDAVDTSHTLTLTTAATLPNGTTATRDDLSPLLLVGGELISYATATPITGGYELTSLRRGAYGTTRASHTPGTPVVVLDADAFYFAVPAERMGETLHVKLVSYNKHDRATQNLADVADHTFTPAATEPPYPDTVTLAVSDTPPATAANQYRETVSESSGVIANGVIAKPRYLRVQWTMDEPFGRS